MRSKIVQEEEVLQERISVMKLVEKCMQKAFFEVENTREFLEETKRRIDLLIKNDF